MFLIICYLQYICIMKSLRAIIMLVVYTAFTVSGVFAKHNCTEVCQPATSHETHEGTLPPTECAEKEVVNIQAAEHRLGSQMKFAIKSTLVPTAVEGKRAKQCVSRLQQSSLQEFEEFSVPLYIRHCKYRL